MKDSSVLHTLLASTTKPATSADDDEEIVVNPERGMNEDEDEEKKEGTDDPNDPVNQARWGLYGFDLLPRVSEEGDHEDGGGRGEKQERSSSMVTVEDRSMAAAAGAVACSVETPTLPLPATVYNFDNGNDDASCFEDVETVESSLPVEENTRSSSLWYNEVLASGGGSSKCLDSGITVVPTIDTLKVREGRRKRGLRVCVGIIAVKVFVVSTIALVITGAMSNRARQEREQPQEGGAASSSALSAGSSSSTTNPKSVPWWKVVEESWQPAAHNQGDHSDRTGNGKDDSSSYLSHAGQMILSELRNGSTTNMTTFDLDHEGQGRTWDVDYRASWGGEEEEDDGADESTSPDWLLYTPRNHLNSRQPIVVPRSCDPQVDDNCDADFHLPDCTHNESICEEHHYGGQAGVAIDPPPPSAICRAVQATRSNPQEQPRKLCVGHSDEFVDDVYKLIISARHHVDVSSLDYPDGRFLAAVRNAITYLHYSSSLSSSSSNGTNATEAGSDASEAAPVVHVRYLVGVYGFKLGVKDILKELTRDLPQEDNKSLVRVSVGYWIKSYPKLDLSNMIHRRYVVNEGVGMSFNHAKIVAVDGTSVMTGGHNLRTGNFLTSSPILDLSVSLRGSVVATSAHQYLDEQWKWICENRHGDRFWQRIHLSGHGNGLSELDLTTFPPPASLHGKRWCPPLYGVGPAGEDKDEDGGAIDGGGNIERSRSSKEMTVFTVGRLAGLSTQPPDLNRGQTSDRAIIALLRSARQTIRLSQQDLGPPGGIEAKKKGSFDLVNYWNLFGVSWVFVELAQAVLRGVSVEVVLSPVGLKSGLAPEENYANGWTLDDVSYMLAWYVQRQRIIDGLGQEMKVGGSTTHHLVGGATASSVPPRDPDESSIDIVCDKFLPTTARYTRDIDEWSKVERCPSLFALKGGVGTEAGTDCDSDEAKLFGLHTKLIIVDDTTFYVGSQNLYSTPLAEWGIIVDDAPSTERLMESFWSPLWDASYWNNDDGDGSLTTRSHSSFCPAPSE